MLDDLKLLYCEFLKYEVMTMSAVRGHPKKKHASTTYKAKKSIEPTFPVSSYWSIQFVLYCFLLLLVNTICNA